MLVFKYLSGPFSRLFKFRSQVGGVLADIRNGDGYCPLDDASFFFKLVYFFYCPLGDIRDVKSPISSPPKQILPRLEGSILGG